MLAHVAFRGRAAPVKNECIWPECDQEGSQVLVTNAGRQVTLMLPFADCCGQERQERGHIPPEPAWCARASLDVSKAASTDACCTRVFWSLTLSPVSASKTQESTAALC